MKKQKQDNTAIVLKIFEELAWSIESNKNNKLSPAMQELRKLYNEFGEFFKIANSYSGYPPGMLVLIGVLPKILNDHDLLPNKNSLLDFSKDILGLNIADHNRPTRNDLIGRIICGTYTLKPCELELATAKATDFILKQIGKTRTKSKRSDQSFAWSDLLQK